MGRQRIARDLTVAMNGIPVATWSRSARGEQRFHYSPDWLAREAAIPVSLSLPLSQEPFTGAVVGNFFDNLLPDNHDIRRRLQARLGAQSAEPFDLLAGIGGDCVGALQIHLAGASAPNVRCVDADELNDEDVADTLRNYRDRPLGIVPDSDFRISIAGAQEKTALLWHQGRWLRPRGATPTSHILKLPIGPGAGGIDMTDSVENEWLCLRLTSAFGLPVAKAAIQTFADQKVLVVERFDRCWSPDGSWLMRNHQEDFCQALGVSPGIKYEADGGPGARQCFELLRRTLHPEQDRGIFFRALIVYWLLAAIDGHAKNYSLMLLPGGRCSMAPLYDVLSAYPIATRHQLQLRKVKMAMAALGNSKHYKWDGILPRHWRATAEQVGLPRADAEAVLHDVVARGSGAIAAVQAQLPAGFPDAVATPIFDGVTRALQLLGAG